MRAWRKVNDVVIGFSGAPGHQGKSPIGSYKYREQPIDRWDPAVARVGDAWGHAAQRGARRVGRIRAVGFSQRRSERSGRLLAVPVRKTWIYAPDRSQNGVLQALRGRQCLWRARRHSLSAPKSA
jgi:hypothetical protein